MVPKEYGTSLAQLEKTLGNWYSSMFTGILLNTWDDPFRLSYEPAGAAEATVRKGKACVTSLTFTEALPYEAIYMSIPLYG